MESHQESVQKHSITGINIQLLNVFFIVITAIVFCFILIISNAVNNRFLAVKNALDKFIICEQSSELIKESSSYLTDQARLFVVTHKTDYVKSYLEEINVNRRQHKALENLEKVCSEKDLALQRLKIALEQGQSLINMELYAIRLAYSTLDIDEIPAQISEIPIRAIDLNVSKEKLQETALNNLFGEGYLIYKTRINENCRLTIAAIEEQIKNDLNLNSNELGTNISRLRFLFLTLLLLNVILFISFAYLIILPLERFKTAIENDERLNVIGSLECKHLAESYNEIYDIKAQNEKSLLKKAEYDSLTGILNRRAFDQICRSSSEKKQQLALLLIDMDNFKYINDNYGHAGGDTALQELARILSETFRTDDYVARIGGDEFVVILPNCSRSASNIIKQKILNVNEKLLNIKDNIKPVSVSVGVAFSDEGFTDDLFKKADKALYIVKEKGKRGCEIYEENYVTEV
ncbi:GGDEF domain-containing protein [Treponema ruminis]|uniref:Diguanylate cyclase (GGDEF)-like protein n=1 Tax=Treponema ruminis TaxID=744515 RepID=A0A7W8LLM7_9SPIR|nr:GGDEF domain-containing protein [Treponema ruminis]MBB5225545.1 diguanylate cyclase (GGDEF)-like protein [Treponema ruminis]QSI01586.1 GGDEF domain-containing protein [Treponema ruminis]